MENNLEDVAKPSSLVLGLCLLFAITMCSSAGDVFDILTNAKGVPPFLAAFWRLFVQNTVQFFPFIFSLRNEWRKDQEKKLMRHHEETLKLKLDSINSRGKKENRENETRNGHEDEFLPRYLKSLPLCCISGLFLGVHFSLWVYSFNYTSLTHSLLWVSMGPIIINGGSWVLHLIGKSQCILTVFAMSSSAFQFRKPSLFETMGALFGIGGAMIMLLGIQQSHPLDSKAERPSNHPPTVYGDSAAFSAAVAVCIYLIIGQKLRAFLPIWLYMWPVVGTATLTCLIFALLDEKDPVKWNDLGERSVFGFLSRDTFLFAFYLGIGPGICGHTLISTLLKHISPLVVSTAMLCEPIFGSIIGYFIGLQPLPDIYTWVGGSILMIGLVLVVIGESNSHEGKDNHIKGSSSQESVGQPELGLYGSIQEDE